MPYDDRYWVLPLAVYAAARARAGNNYEKLTVQNAVEARRWHVVLNQVGPVGYGEDYGHSRIVQPNGEIIADTGGQEGMVVAEIDLYTGRDAVRDR